MVILGIHDGHNASACLIIDGKLVWRHSNSNEEE